MQDNIKDYVTTQEDAKEGIDKQPPEDPYRAYYLNRYSNLGFDKNRKKTMRKKTIIKKESEKVEKEVVKSGVMC